MNKEQLAELNAVIALLKAHPERHDQSVWVKYQGDTAPVVTPELDCGSAFCIAGAVVARSGATLHWEEWEVTEWNPNQSWSAYLVTVDPNTHDGYGTMSIPMAARDLLGLSYREGEELFWYGNTMADIERYRDQFAREYGLNEVDA